tara:strand:+ start:737 stop:1621 length:885 start_codon:yes stop_codon:yes gene_type:complete
MIAKCRNKEFQVYDLDEARKEGIDYTDDWRNAEKGDWILTSDDKVLQVIGKKTENRKDRKKPVVFIKIGYGYVPTYKAGVYAKKYPDWWYDKGYRYDLVRDLKPTAKQLMFLERLVDIGDLDETGMWSHESIVKAYQAVYRDNNPNTSLLRGRMILKKKKVKQVMAELMKDKLSAVGLDDDYIAIKYKEFVEDDGIAANVRLNALNKVTELRGHFDKQTEQIEGQTFIAMSDGDKKMLAQARKALSNDELAKFMQTGDFNGINQRKDTRDKRRTSKPRHKKQNAKSSREEVQTG